MRKHIRQLHIFDILFGYNVYGIFSMRRDCAIFHRVVYTFHSLSIQNPNGNMNEI